VLAESIDTVLSKPRTAERSVKVRALLSTIAGMCIFPVLIIV
jgi:hypothetical protein